MDTSTKVLISVSDPEIDPDPHESALIFSLLDRIGMAFVPKLVCFMTHSLHKEYFSCENPIFVTADMDPN